MRVGKLAVDGMDQMHMAQGGYKVVSIVWRIEAAKYLLKLHTGNQLAAAALGCPKRSANIRRKGFLLYH